MFSFLFFSFEVSVFALLQVLVRLKEGNEKALRPFEHLISLSLIYGCW